MVGASLTLAGTLPKAFIPSAAITGALSVGIYWFGQKRPMRSIPKLGSPFGVFVIVRLSPLHGLSETRKTRTCLRQRLYER